MSTILLLEDHPATAQWLTAIAQEAFIDSTVFQAPNITKARQWLGIHNCNVALLDIHLPDGSGIDLIASIRSRTPDTTIVMTTIFDDDQHLFDALRAGAQGYLLKEHKREDLIQRLQGIHAGEPPLSPGIARRMLAYFNPSPVTNAHVLSPREEETLTLLAKGYSVKELARILIISDHTAAGYVKNIYRKLNVNSRAEATLAASRLGLVRG